MICRRVHPFALAALATLVVAGCGFGGGTPSASHPAASPPTPSSSSADAPHASGPSPTPTVMPPPGTSALSRQVHGQGSGEVGTIDVPRRYAIAVACAGVGQLVIVVDGEDQLASECGPHSEGFVDIVNRPADRRVAHITIRASTGLRWAVVVTSDPHVPS